MGLPPNRRSRLLVAGAFFVVALVALIIAVTLLLASRAPVSAVRAIAPFDAVTVAQRSYTPVPTCPPGSKDCTQYVIVPLPYAQVDYPQQVQVNDSDTATLTLSVNGNVLSFGPQSGDRGILATAPINLPGDLQNYQDIDVSVRTIAPDNGHVIWQLLGPPQESLLLRNGTTVRYVPAAFRWKVTAVSAGPDDTRLACVIALHHTDGSQSLLPEVRTDSPVPILAVAPPPAASALPFAVISLGSITTVVVLVLDTFGRLHEALEFVSAFKVVRDAQSKTMAVVRRYRLHQLKAPWANRGPQERAQHLLPLQPSRTLHGGHVVPSERPPSPTGPSTATHPPSGTPPGGDQPAQDS